MLDRSIRTSDTGPEGDLCVHADVSSWLRWQVRPSSAQQRQQQQWHELRHVCRARVEALTFFPVVLGCRSASAMRSGGASRTRRSARSSEGPISSSSTRGT